MQRHFWKRISYTHGDGQTQLGQVEGSPFAKMNSRTHLTIMHRIVLKTQSLQFCIKIVTFLYTTGSRVSRFLISWVHTAAKVVQCLLKAGVQTSLKWTPLWSETNLLHPQNGPLRNVCKMFLILYKYLLRVDLSGTIVRPYLAWIIDTVPIWRGQKFSFHLENKDLPTYHISSNKTPSASKDGLKKFTLFLAPIGGTHRLSVRYL